MTPAAFELADDLTTSGCDDLLDSYIERAQREVGPWGWNNGPMWRDATFDRAGRMPLVAVSETSNGYAGRTVRATSNEAGTNVQEAGVDEPDVVKVDGDTLVRLVRRQLTVWDASGTEPTQIGELRLEDHRAGRLATDPTQLLLVGDVVVVIGNDLDEPNSGRVNTVDISDPAAPQIMDSVVIDGRIDQARLHGEVIRLVVDKPLPDLDFVQPRRWWRGDDRAIERNRRIVAKTTLADWLPTVDGRPVVDCTQVALPDDAALGTTVVVAFDPTATEVSDVEGWNATGVATAAGTTYVSADRLYLASTSASDWLLLDCWNCRSVGEQDGRTRIDAFALSGEETTWVAGGTVDGYIRDRWSMDAVGGSLRVAVGPSTATGDFNSVVTMAEDGTDLTEVGRVDRLGPREEIKSVRWFDDLAIVVTFRQTDPLYAVDLTDPRAPELIGELKIPGYSEYLHPLGPRRLIGMGQDAESRWGTDLGAQAALFDVHDLTAVRQLDVTKYRPHSRAGAAGDPRQFTWLPERRTALTVISKGWAGRTGWVSVLRVQNGRLHNRMIEVDHGSSVNRIRTVPLASGQVALVTDDDVTFLDL